MEFDRICGPNRTSGCLLSVLGQAWILTLDDGGNKDLVISFFSGSAGGSSPS